MENDRFGGQTLPEALASARILIVEDDARMAESLASGLGQRGYQTTVAPSGEDAFFLVHSMPPDLIVLDLTLPKRGGLEILKQLRAEKLDIRVLILTSHNSVEDRVAGLNAGADDYLGKPFSFPELLARVASLLRRVPIATPVAATSLHLADLKIDKQTRGVSRSGTPIDLTPREFDLLIYLLDHRDNTVSREMLAKDVWSEVSRFTPLDNVIDVQMARLRRKLDDPFPIKLLHTVRGMGFILKEPAP
ncbi:response regulator transcription factor [Granulicella sibirica]|uniref:Phosphate regulon transcriptional regulatory protein PhoB (SphR) n=1 Tax=Granulicella sibirica TaxID=2479048 RepID=A0A4Q0T3X0_9BACT|nr:response regulator transcription factor [Granulicella sibirica]RXH57997.1 Phosphate regulon transcriptional regulatory protein PhoB (SphR) [Granulicella sibirica]